MNIVVYNRDSSQAVNLPLELKVETYSWHMIGGPEKAILTSPVTMDKWELTKLLRCPIEIYGDDGVLVWWGYINRVAIPHGLQQHGLSLDSVFNHVTIQYEEGMSIATSDDESIAEYGQKEVIINDYNQDGTQAANTRDLFLSEHKYPHPEIDFSGGNDEIKIECYGWYNTLGWKHYSNASTTDAQNTAQIEAIISSVGQFLNGSIVEQSSGILSNPYRSNVNGLSAVNELLSVGTSNIRPLLAKVDKDKYLHIYERSANPPSGDIDFLLNLENKLEAMTGEIEPDQHCKCAVWVQVKDMPNSAESLGAMQPFFIERAEYNASSKETTYTPAGAFEANRLAMFVEDVVTGSNQVSWGRNFLDLVDDSDTGISFWAAIGMSTDDVANVEAFAKIGDILYIGGDFNEIAGVRAENIIQLDLSTGIFSDMDFGLWQSGLGAGSGVKAMAVSGSNLYVAGEFERAGQVADNPSPSTAWFVRWDGAAWQSIAPVAPAPWFPCFTGAVYDLLVVDGDIYIAHSTLAEADPDTEGVVVMDLATENFTALDLGLDGDAKSICWDADNEILYACGPFEQDNNAVAMLHLAQWNGAAWSAVGGGIPNPGEGYCVEMFKGNMYVCGNFTTAGTATVSYLAKWDGSSLTDPSGGLDDIGRWMFAYGDILYIVGDFQNAGSPSISANRVVKYTGSGYKAMGDGLSGSGGTDGYAVWTDDGETILVGGDFETAGGKVALGAALYFEDLQTAMDYSAGGYGNSPGGPDGSVQYNNDGKFGGQEDLRWDRTYNVLAIGGAYPSEGGGGAGTEGFYQVCDGAAAAHTLISYGSRPFIAGNRANTSQAAPSTVNLNDELFLVRARGHDGTAFSGTRSSIEFVADGNWAVGDHPTRIEILTTPASSITNTIRTIIDNAGLFTIGPTAGTARFTVDGISDIIQGVFQAHSTQTANILEAQNSSAALLSGIDYRGNLICHLSTSATNFFGGPGSGNTTATGTSNTGLGVGTLLDLTSGVGNIAFGGESLYNVQNASYNTAAGFRSGYTTVGGGYNSFFGPFSGYSNSAGTNNTFMGYTSGYYQLGSYKFIVDAVLRADAATELTSSIIVGSMSATVTNQTLRFNAAVTIPDSLVIDGSSDEIQFKVQAHSTQTTLLAVFEDSAGNDQITFSGVGGAVFNEEGNDADFRIESDNEDKIFYVDAGADVVRIGDYDTNYTQFAVDGEITLVGTARVKKEISIEAVSLAPGSTGPDAVILGNYLGYSFDIGDDSVTDFEVPYDWDTSTDLEVYIYWYCNEDYVTNSGEVQWRIQWSATPTDETETVDAPTHTGTIDYGDQDIPANAKKLTKSSAGTIAAASLAEGDLVGLTIDRVALDGGANPAADPVIVRIEVEYTSNKLGEAT